MTKREISIGVICLALGLLGGILLNLPQDDPSSRTYQDEVAAERAGSETDETEAVEEPAYTPTTDDFAMKVRVKEKQCFGSAGCNVTVALEPEYTGAATGDDSFEITYELSGDESGPIVGSFTLKDDTMNFQPETSLSTANGDAKVEAEITSVDIAY